MLTVWHWPQHLQKTVAIKAESTNCNKSQISRSFSKLCRFQAHRALYAKVGCSGDPSAWRCHGPHISPSGRVASCSKTLSTEMILHCVWWGPTNTLVHCELPLWVKMGCAYRALLTFEESVLVNNGGQVVRMTTWNSKHRCVECVETSIDIEYTWIDPVQGLWPRNLPRWNTPMKPCPQQTFESNMMWHATNKLISRSSSSCIVIRTFYSHNEIQPNPMKIKPRSWIFLGWRSIHRDARQGGYTLPKLSGQAMLTLGNTKNL